MKIPIYTSFAATHVGLKRDRNQDQAVASGRVYAVCDGLGGEPAGETAAAMVITRILEAATSGTLQELCSLVERISEDVSAAGDTHPELSGMMTTLTALVAHETDAASKFFAVHAGDSRLYLYNENGLRQVTADHNEAGRLLESGEIDAHEVSSHYGRHQLTSAMGWVPTRVDGFELAMVPGDRWLLCTDGLHGEVIDYAIEQTMRQNVHPVAAANALIERALSSGGSDNIAVSVLNVYDGDAAVGHDADTDRVIQSLSFNA